MSDQIYIDTIKEQVASGMYDKLFGNRRDLVFLDIGANIGIVSIYAVPYCKRIVAVEPSPSTYKTLVDNTRNYPIIECLQVALTPTDGPQRFFVNDLNFTASSTVNTYGTQTTVSGVTLSMLLDGNDLDHIHVCKCDCEGAEGDALNYDQLYQAKDIIDTWFIETHNCPTTTWEHKLGTIVGNLARCGYHKQTIDGMSITASK